mgnify:CR=1 FL=1
MEATNGSNKEKSLFELFLLIFIPTIITTSVYIFIGYLHNAIPSLLLFFICTLFILFPIELGIIIYASKKEYGRYSLKSAFSRQEKMSWLKISLYGIALFAISGIGYVAVAPLENYLLAPVANQLAQLTPEYFNWNNLEYLKQYSKDIIL